MAPVATLTDPTLANLLDEVLDDATTVLAEAVVDVLEEAERVAGLVDELEAGLLEVTVLDLNARRAIVDETAALEAAVHVAVFPKIDLLVDEDLVPVLHRWRKGEGGFSPWGRAAPMPSVR